METLEKRESFVYLTGSSMFLINATRANAKVHVSVAKQEKHNNTFTFQLISFFRDRRTQYCMLKGAEIYEERR